MKKLVAITGATAAMLFAAAPAGAVPPSGAFAVVACTPAADGASPQAAEHNRAPASTTKALLPGTTGTSNGQVNSPALVVGDETPERGEPCTPDRSG